MRVQDLVDAMQQIAPLAYAEPWDRAGLIIGSPERKITGPVLLTIDLSEAVLAEAIELKSGAIVAYHCPIWDPMLTMTDATAKERIVRGAIEAGLAIYSPHTSLDAAPGGVTDWLCEGLSEGNEGQIAGDCRALQSHHERDVNQELKVVVFVPEEHVDNIRNVLGTAGAGSIGSYKICSFSVAGTGTFFGGEGSNPRVGQAGRLEKVGEHRLEMVCSRASLALVIQTLREFHPYEQPAIDVYELHGSRDRTVGLGRRLVLDRPATVSELARRLARHLNTDRVKYALAGSVSPDAPMRRVGVVPGAGEDLADLASREACEVFVTGEMRYHAVVKLLEQGVSVILGGHTNTERGYLARLARRLDVVCPDAQCVVSVRDRDLFKMVENGH